MNVDDPLVRAETLMRTGQSVEAQATTSGDLTQAVRHYEEALELLRSIAPSDERVRHAIAIVSMNRGNALHRQQTPELLEQAVAAYDEAIQSLQTLPLDQFPDLRNTLGAAWMNRGHALASHPTRQAESIPSLHKAVEVLRKLPLEGRPFYRVNFAAALMNAANAALRLGNLEQALASAREATETTASAEKTECVVADIGLKARRVFADALRIQAAAQRGNSEAVENTVSLATDVVEDGLELAKFWEHQNRQELRPAALRLFELGVHLYAVHMPNFVAEFILDQIEPESTGGGLHQVDPFYAVALGVLGEMRTDLESRRALFTATEQTSRLIQRLQDLRSAEARLIELRQTFVLSADPSPEASVPT